MNKIVRGITNSTQYSPLSPLYKELNCLKLTEIYKLEPAKSMHQLQNNKLSKLFQDLFCKIDTVRDHNTRYASKNAYFRLRVKKCITQNILAFKESKLWTNIKDVYKNKEFSTANFKKNYKKFLISKY